MKYALIFYVSMTWPIDGSVWHGHYQMDTFHSRKQCEIMKRRYVADNVGRYRCERVRG